MPKLAVLAPRSWDFMDNSNAPIQFNILNKQLVGKLWNICVGLYFNYIKVPKMFWRVDGWLSIIHRSGSWNLHWDTTHTSYNPGIGENVDQVIRIQHHTNTVFKPSRHKAFGLTEASKSPFTQKLPKLLKNDFAFMGCYICTMLEGCFVCLFHFLLWDCLSSWQW